MVVGSDGIVGYSKTVADGTFRFPHVHRGQYLVRVAGNAGVEGIGRTAGHHPARRDDHRQPEGGREPLEWLQTNTSRLLASGRRMPSRCVPSTMGSATNPFGCFRPLGPKTTVDATLSIAQDNLPERDVKFDVVAWQESGDRLVLLWNTWTPPSPLRTGGGRRLPGRGIGTALGRSVMSVAGRRGVRRVILTVVKDNWRAIRLYEGLSFSSYAEFIDQVDGR